MTLWLTRLRLNQRSRDVRRDLRDAVAVHRRLMSLVPDSLGDQARQAAGMLYRVDETATGIGILVQTNLQPDLTKLPPSYADSATVDLSTFVAALGPGQTMHYRICANASKRVAKSDGPHAVGQIVALTGTAAADWWQRQAATHGLTLVTSFAQPMPQARGQRTDGHTVRHAVTRFDGVATVHDSDLLREAVTHGIGRGKSYGCGMLSLAALRPTAR